jgi:hypothetical protein
LSGVLEFSGPSGSSEFKAKEVGIPSTLERGTIDQSKGKIISRPGFLKEDVSVHHQCCVVQILTVFGGVKVINENDISWLRGTGDRNRDPSKEVVDGFSGRRKHRESLRSRL